MLKKILLNGKKIPVPVPIKSLPDAIAWVEKHLLRPDHMLTRIQIEGKDIDLQLHQDGRLPAMALDAESDLRVQIDSPAEICLQTIDALRNLSSVVGRNLKPVAVQLWEHKGSKLPPETRSVLDDVDLMIELMDHVLVLMDRRVELSTANGLQDQIRKASVALDLALRQSDFRGIAKVLLNQLEPPVLDLSSELTSLEKSVFEIQVDRHLERRSSGSRA